MFTNDQGSEWFSARVTASKASIGYANFGTSDAHTDTNTHALTHACTHARTHAHTHTYTYIHTHTHTKLRAFDT